MKKFFRIVSIVLFALLLFASLAACDSLLSTEESNSEQIENKDIFTYQVLSDSMYPVFKSGDRITIKRVEDVSSLKVGNIICYYTVINGERVMTVSRIVSIYEDSGVISFETKGDNNTVANPLAVYENDVVGIYLGGAEGSSSEQTEKNKTFKYKVLTDRMYPTFKSGDTVLFRSVDDASSLKVGDIICYYTIIGGEIVMNIGRIVNVYQGEDVRIFETKGDNNDLVDSLTVHEKDIVGVFK